MQKIPISLIGFPYQVTTDETPEYVQSLAEKVNRGVSEMMCAMPESSVLTAALLSSFEFCDEAAKAEAALTRAKQQNHDIFEELRKRTAEEEESRREISRLLGEISLLKQQLSERGVR